MNNSEDSENRNIRTVLEKVLPYSKMRNHNLKQPHTTELTRKGEMWNAKVKLSHYMRTTTDRELLKLFTKKL